MATLTAEQAKQDYIDKMGEPLGTQFAELWQEVARFHMKWLEYVELFGTKESRFDLMNQAAPCSFGWCKTCFGRTRYSTSLGSRTSRTTGQESGG
jgi:hypothetical protein